MLGVHVDNIGAVAECVRFEYKQKFNGYSPKLGISTEDKTYYFIKDAACDAPDGGGNTSVATLIGDVVVTFQPSYETGYAYVPTDDSLQHLDITMCNEPKLKAYGTASTAQHLYRYQHLCYRQNVLEESCVGPCSRSRSG